MRFWARWLPSSTTPGSLRLRWRAALAAAVAAALSACSAGGVSAMCRGGDSRWAGSGGGSAGELCPASP